MFFLYTSPQISEVAYQLATGCKSLHVLRNTYEGNIKRTLLAWEPFFCSSYCPPVGQIPTNVLISFILGSLKNIFVLQCGAHKPCYELPKLGCEKNASKVRSSGKVKVWTCTNRRPAKPIIGRGHSCELQPEHSKADSDQLKTNAVLISSYSFLLFWKTDFFEFSAKWLPGIIKKNI